MKTIGSLENLLGQDTGAIIITTNMKMNAISPDVDITFGTQITFRPFVYT